MNPRGADRGVDPSLEAVSAAADSYIGSFAAAYGIPGASACLIVGGQPLAAFAGVKSAGGGPVTRDAVFHAASISKTLTATAAMILAERGAFGLDDAIGDLLPEFATEAGAYRRATVRQVLGHTAGFPDVDDYRWHSPEYDEGALGRYVASCPSMTPLGEPGAAFHYSNVGYEVLGHLVATASGRPFEAFVREELLDALGMGYSTFYQPEVPEGRRALPHVAAPSVRPAAHFPYSRAHAPSSTLQTTADDMARWAGLWMGGEEGPLSAAARAEMISPYVETGRSRAILSSMGAAWFLGERRGLRTLSHAGRDLGFSSILIIAPERRAAAFAACNLSPVPVEALGEGLLDIALGEGPAPVRRPAVLECLGAYAAGGFGALAEAYGAARSVKPGGLDFSPGYLQALAESTLEAGEAEAAIDLMRLGLMADPGNERFGAALKRAQDAPGRRPL